MTFHVPEKFRITQGRLASTWQDGNNGAFVIVMRHKQTAMVLASDGMGWEHVSVSRTDRCLTWRWCSKTISRASANRSTETKGIPMQIATHTANPVSVNAATILDVTEQPGGNLMLRLSDGRNYTADTSMTVRHYPVVGDYLVTQDDGYEYLNPKDVFERKYRAIEDQQALEAKRADLFGDFGYALGCLKLGHSVARAGWNGKGIFIRLQTPDANSKMTSPYIYIDTTGLQSDNADAPRSCVPWLASQTDMLAKDWQIVE